MPRFLAEVELTFECSSPEAVGREFRRLSQAAQDAGFELRRGNVVPAPPEDDDASGWTEYGPPIEPGG